MMGSRAYEEQQGRNEEIKAAMIRRGNVECNICGQAFMPEREDDDMCEDCIDRVIKD
ncbi:hypothetical protein JNUCC71_01455 [Carnobacterium divergens]